MSIKLNKHIFGFYEVVNKPTASELQDYYAQKYYQEARGSYEHQYTQDELQYFENKLNQRYIAALNALGVQEDFVGSLLDVGCGEGFVINYFKNKGFTVKGLDFSSAGVELKNPNCIDLLVTGDLFELLDKEVTCSASSLHDNYGYDIVWLQNVLEHVLDPVALMKTLRHLVNKDGIAVITVPNDFSATQLEALNQEHIKTEFWVYPPDHLSYFNNKSLTNIAKETGWKVVDLLGDFPIDWYLYHPSSNYVSQPKAGKGAHQARIQLENVIAKEPIEDVLALWRSMAKIGYSRNLTIFIKPNK